LGSYLGKFPQTKPLASRVGANRCIRRPREEGREGAGPILQAHDWMEKAPFGECRALESEMAKSEPGPGHWRRLGRASYKPKITQGAISSPVLPLAKRGLKLCLKKHDGRRFVSLNGALGTKCHGEEKGKKRRSWVTSMSRGEKSRQRPIQKATRCQGAARQ